MPRKPRFIIPHVPVHIVQRGHSRNPVFFDDADYLAYLNWLKAGALRYKVAVHAYVLIQSRSHLGYADGCGRPCPHDAVCWSPLCTLRQLHLW